MSIRSGRVVAWGVLGLGFALGFRAFLAVAREPRPADAPRVFAKANKQTIAAYVVLLRLRHDLFLKWKETGKWPDDREANAALAAHGKYWAKRLEEGTALMAGGMKGDYWDNVAMIVFEAPSEEEARRIARDDPGVKSYVFQAQVRPFDVLYLTNKFQAE
jgi:uncharacterized protein YciI